MIDPHESNGRPFLSDRRHYGRQKVLFSSVVIGESNRGRVLNLSPNGVVLQTDEELIDNELPIRFNFSQAQPWVEVRGRIVWKNASRKVAGIEFISPTDEVCKQIQTWIASQRDSSESPKTTTSLEKLENRSGTEASSEIATEIPAPAPVARMAKNPSQLSTFSLVRSSAETQDAGTVHVARGSSKAGRLAGWSLALVLLLLALVPLRQHLHKEGRSPKGQEMTNPPGLSSKSSAAPNSNPVPSSDHPGRSSLLGPSLAHPAYVLQVGAMVHEENANALAESLSRMNFPAFVFNRPTDRFHRVLVGPYNSVDAALRAKDELNRKGFKAIRTEWKPQTP
jgi:cell division septation protein DedD